MNFKEIRLVGFKSFADKTTIQFEDGVTCIVGPNGCGKSNVADSVRWVLGEQSAKTLRGSSMQDVIFNGTQRRKSLSFCEVELVFDNSTRLFDVDYDEVAITRRLYRSGESEYLLNKQACRLKDIVNMLHGVGIGKEGYSIIGQGKVEQIMNAKPEDRRSIFEEATGIMIYKLRKQEIERKIDNSEENLSIYKQRIDEAERQLRPLEKQAETARAYNELYAQLKRNEVNTYVYRTENAEVEKRRYLSERQKNLDESVRLNEEIAAINVRYDENREKIDQADSRLSELNAALLQYTVGIERKSGEAKVVRERAKYFRNQLSAATDDVNYCVRRTDEIEKELKKSAALSASTEKKIAALTKESISLTGEIARLDSEIAVIENWLEENRANELSSVENLSEVKRNMGSLSARKEALEERKREATLAYEKTRSRRDSLSEQLSATEKKLSEITAFLSDKEETLADRNDEIKSLIQNINAFQQDISNTSGQIASLQNSLNFYNELKNRFDGYRDSVRRLLLKAQSDPFVSQKVKGAVANLINTDADYEVAIETAIGGAMQNVVTATADDARSLIEYLKKTSGGVVTFLPVDSMRVRPTGRDIERALNERGAVGLADELVRYEKYYEPVVKNLLGNTLVVDTIYNATAIAKKYSHAFKIVTLDGDTVSTSGAMTGGSKRKDSGNLLAGERQIKECEDKIAAKQHTLEKLQKALSSCTADRAEAEKELAELRQKYENASTEYALSSQQRAALVESLSEAEGDLSVYAGVLDSLKEREKDIENESAASEENAEAISKIRAVAAEELDKQRAENEKYRAEREQKNTKYLSLQLEISAENNTLETEKINFARLTSEKASLSQKLKETQENIVNIQLTIEDLDKEAERKSLTQEEQQAVERLRGEIERMGKDKQRINAEQLSLDVHKNDLIAKVSACMDKKNRCEVEISKIETNLENLKVRIEEEYHLSYEECVAMKDEAFDVSTAFSETVALKRKITMLGAVNPNAIADYEELKARYDDMSAQRDDIEKSLLDLNTVLKDLKSEMQKQFDEGFKTINENFKHIFKELFGGGNAELQLDYTDCPDPLDAGVEIVACPPGKKLTKISLMSGGERALTAIAILFAIIKSRPMPFCILDEIEAALDDANVDRFAQYLKKFSKDTQFIVITHRKPTMNQADSLFGVTMEEKGVSKIVSVKLSEVETRLGAGTVE